MYSNFKIETSIANDVDKDSAYFDLIKMLESEEPNNFETNQSNDISYNSQFKDDKKEIISNQRQTIKSTNITPLRATVAPIRNESIMSASTSNMTIMNNNTNSKLSESPKCTTNRRLKKDDNSSCMGGSVVGNGGSIGVGNMNNSISTTNISSILDQVSSFNTNNQMQTIMPTNLMLPSHPLSYAPQHASHQHPQFISGGPGNSIVCLMAPQQPHTDFHHHQQHQQHQLVNNVTNPYNHHHQFVLPTNMVFSVANNTNNTSTPPLIANNTTSCTALTGAVIPALSSYTNSISTSTNPIASATAISITSTSSLSASSSSNTLPKLLPKPQNSRQPLHFITSANNNLNNNVSNLQQHVITNKRSNNNFNSHANHNNSILSSNTLPIPTSNNRKNHSVRPRNSNNKSKQSKAAAAAAIALSTPLALSSSSPSNVMSKDTNVISQQQQHIVSSTPISTKSSLAVNYSQQQPQHKDNVLMAWEQADIDEEDYWNVPITISTHELSSINNTIFIAQTLSTNYKDNTGVFTNIPVVKQNRASLIEVEPYQFGSKKIIERMDAYGANATTITSQSTVDYGPFVSLYHQQSHQLQESVLQLLYAHLNKHGPNSVDPVTNPLLKYLLPTTQHHEPLSVVCDDHVMPISTEDDDLLSDISPAKRNSTQLANLDMLLERSCRPISLIGRRSNTSPVPFSEQSEDGNNGNENTNDNHDDEEEDNNDDDCDEDDDDEEDEENNTTNDDEDDDEEDNNDDDDDEDDNCKNKTNHRRRKSSLPYQLKPDEQYTLQQYLTDLPTSSWLKRTKNKNKWIHSNTIIKCSRVIETCKSNIETSPLPSLGNIGIGEAKKKCSYNNLSYNFTNDFLIRSKFANTKLKKTEKYKVKIESIKRKNKHDKEKIKSGIQIEDITDLSNNTNNNENKCDIITNNDKTCDQMLGNWKIANSTNNSNDSSGMLKIRLKLQNNNNNNCQMETKSNVSEMKPNPSKREIQPQTNNKRKSITQSTTSRTAKISAKKATPLPKVVTNKSRNRKRTSSKIVTPPTLLPPPLPTPLTTINPTLVNSLPSPKKIFCTRKEDRRSSALLNYNSNNNNSISETLSQSSNSKSSSLHQKSKLRLSKHHTNHMTSKLNVIQKHNPPIILKVSQSKLKTATTSSQHDINSLLPKSSSGSKAITTTTTVATTTNSSSTIATSTINISIPQVSTGSMKLRIKRTPSSAVAAPIKPISSPIILSPAANLVAPSSLMPNVTVNPTPIIPISFSPAPSSSDSDTGTAAHNEITSLLQRQDQLEPLNIPSTVVTSTHSSVSYLVGSSPTVFIDRNKVDLILVKNSSYKKHSNSTNNLMIASSCNKNSNSQIPTSASSSRSRTPTLTVSSSLPDHLATSLANSVVLDVVTNNATPINSELFLPGCFIDNQKHHNSNSPSMPVLAPQEPLTGYNQIQHQPSQLQQSPLCMSMNTLSTSTSNTIPHPPSYYNESNNIIDVSTSQSLQQQQQHNDYSWMTQNNNSNNSDYSPSYSHHHHQQHLSQHHNQQQISHHHSHTSSSLKRQHSTTSNIHDPDIQPTNSNSNNTSSSNISSINTNNSSSNNKHKRIKEDNIETSSVILPISTTSSTPSASFHHNQQQQQQQHHHSSLQLPHHQSSSSASSSMYQSHQPNHLHPHQQSTSAVATAADIYNVVSAASAYPSNLDYYNPSFSNFILSDYAALYSGAHSSGAASSGMNAASIPWSSAMAEYCRSLNNPAAAAASAMAASNPAAASAMAAASSIGSVNNPLSSLAVNDYAGTYQYPSMPQPYMYSGFGLPK